MLQECLNRSTDDYITTRCLLEYGLERTSFRSCYPMMFQCVCELNIFCRELMSEMEEESSIKLSADIRKELVMEELEKIEKLSLEQISICRFRYMLLCYLDRLETYEVLFVVAVVVVVLSYSFMLQVILSEPTSVFESTEYEKFRSDNLVPSAITYARVQREGEGEEEEGEEGGRGSRRDGGRERREGEGVHFLTLIITSNIAVFVFYDRRVIGGP